MQFICCSGSALAPFTSRQLLIHLAKLWPRGFWISYANHFHFYCLIYVFHTLKIYGDLFTLFQRYLQNVRHPRSKSHSIQSFLHNQIRSALHILVLGSVLGQRDPFHTSHSFTIPRDNIPMNFLFSCTPPRSETFYKLPETLN